jgi:hypothetical protein
MERLKTPAEKKAEIEEFRKQRKREEFEMSKLCIMQIINACTDMPIRLTENDDLWHYWNDDDVKAVSVWLNENGYMLTATTDSYGRDEYLITMK